MSKETKNSKSSVEQETKQARQLIKRRLVGALIVFSVAFILWQIGDELPPQPVFRDVPEVPDDLLNATESDSEEDIAVVVEEAEDATAETPAAIVVTAETTENDKVRVSTVTSVVSSAIEKTDDTEQDKPVKSEETRETEKIAQVEKSEKTAKTEKAEKPKQTAVADSGGLLFRFQAGAFKDVKNANLLAEKLAAQDLATQIETAGEWHRLYVVDLPDAAAVTVAQATVKRLAAERQATGEKPADKETAEEFVLQVGAFSQGGRSQRIARRLKKEGFTVQLKPVDKEGEKLTRVRVLVSGQHADAEAARVRLIQLGYEQTKIVD